MSISDLTSFKTAYLAPADYIESLKSELTGIVGEFGRLIVTDRPPYNPSWCHNIWLDPVIIKIDSISDGANKLRKLNKHWANLPFKFYRRAKLIEEQLTKAYMQPLEFPPSKSLKPYGSWMLLDSDTIFASPHCSSPFPNGEPNFAECKLGPPSRAYLKLWEAFTLLGRWPQKGDRCLDLGASPGGWSWVLANLGGDVVAVDKAPLDKGVSIFKNVEWIKGDGFSILPKKLGNFDWVLSDMIAFPERIYDLIKIWHGSEVKNIIFTIKFKDKSRMSDHRAIVNKLRALRGGKLIHLAHNKHELTWFSSKN